MCDLKSGSRACAESMPRMVVCRLIACDSVRMRRDHEMRSACGRSDVVRTKGAGMMFVFCREAFSCMLNRVDLSTNDKSSGVVRRCGAELKPLRGSAGSSHDKA